MQIEIKNKKTAAKSISTLLKKNYEVKTIKGKLKKKLWRKKTKSNESQTYRTSEKVRKKLRVAKNNDKNKRFRD